MSEIRSWNPFPILSSAHDSSRASFTGWMGLFMRQCQTRTVLGANIRSYGNTGGPLQEPYASDYPILGSEDIWEVPLGDDGNPRNATEVRRGGWGIMMGGVIPVYSEWYWNYLMGHGEGEAEVRRMFGFFYSITRYRQYQQLNNLVSGTARQIASGIPGQESLVYDEDGGSITINLSDTSSASNFSVL